MRLRKPFPTTLKCYSYNYLKHLNHTADQYLRLIQKVLTIKIDEKTKSYLLATRLLITEMIDDINQNRLNGNELIKYLNELKELHCAKVMSPILFNNIKIIKIDYCWQKRS